VLPGVLCLHTPMRSTIRDCSPFATNQPNKLNFGPVPIVISSQNPNPPPPPPQVVLGRSLPSFAMYFWMRLQMNELEEQRLTNVRRLTRI